MLPEVWGIETMTNHLTIVSQIIQNLAIAIRQDGLVYEDLVASLIQPTNNHILWAKEVKATLRVLTHLKFIKKAPGNILQNTIRYKILTPGRNWLARN